ncbi:hypothetical protein E2562_022656 [Oryza meyeriana var. granulata]|uniref:Uncharacterized protein n=1 Tax=Oryza meyeriana var. granulata TaxID=110450 RepID=A0A6G1DZV4_9ORYZ|nr:hypothetical protein E2562_022656 [Oryza meyeriana var. granulata]
MWSKRIKERAAISAHQPLPPRSLLLGSSTLPAQATMLDGFDIAACGAQPLQPQSPWCSIAYAGGGNSNAEHLAEGWDRRTTSHEPSSCSTCRQRGSRGGWKATAEATTERTGWIAERRAITMAKEEENPAMACRKLGGGDWST